MSTADPHLLTRDLLRGVYDLLVPADSEVVGLVITHKGLSMRLYPPDNPESDPRRIQAVAAWTATCDAVDHDGERDAFGLGVDPVEALDACAADVATQSAAQRKIDEANDA